MGTFLKSFDSLSTVVRGLFHSSSAWMNCFAAERGEDGPADHPYRFEPCTAQRAF